MLVGILEFPFVQWLPSKLGKCSMVMYAMAFPPECSMRTTGIPRMKSAGTEESTPGVLGEGDPWASFQSTWWCQQSSLQYDGALVLHTSGIFLCATEGVCCYLGSLASNGPPRGGGQADSLLLLSLWLSSHFWGAPLVSPFFFKVYIFSIFFNMGQFKEKIWDVI